MKNEVKKKMTRQEREVVVLKSLNQFFCKGKIHAIDARVVCAAIFFLTIIIKLNSFRRD
jgi:hypothetical protein